MFGKRFFSAQAIRRAYEGSQHMRQETFAEFKADIKYILDKQIQSNTDMMKIQSHSNADMMNKHMQMVSTAMESQSRSNSTIIKIGFAALGSVMTIIGAGLAWGYDKIKDDMTEIKSSITENKDSIAKLDTKMNQCMDKLELLLQKK